MGLIPQNPGNPSIYQTRVQNIISTYLFLELGSHTCSVSRSFPALCGIAPFSTRNQTWASRCTLRPVGHFSCRLTKWLHLDSASIAWKRTMVKDHLSHNLLSQMTKSKSKSLRSEWNTNQTLKKKKFSKQNCGLVTAPLKGSLRPCLWKKIPLNRETFLF